MFNRRKNHEATEWIEHIIATGRADTAEEAELLHVIEALKPAPLPSSLTDIAIHRAVKRQIEAERQQELGLLPERVARAHVYNSSVAVPSAQGSVQGNLYDAVEPISAERAKLACAALAKVLDKLRARTT